jgi:hypothetical protein
VVILLEDRNLEKKKLIESLSGEPDHEVSGRTRPIRKQAEEEDPIDEISMCTLFDYISLLLTAFSNLNQHLLENYTHSLNDQ